MTSSGPLTATLRLLRDSETNGKPKGYLRTVRLYTEGIDNCEKHRAQLFTGDVIGKALSNPVAFNNPDGSWAFTIAPHRKIMPMRWPVTSADGHTIGVLRQRVFSKGFWSGMAADGDEQFRVIDAQSRADKIAMYVLDGVVSRYAFVVGDILLGVVREELREKNEATGMRGLLKALAIKPDPVLKIEKNIMLPDLRLLAMALFLLYEITVPLDRST